MNVTKRIAAVGSIALSASIFGVGVAGAESLPVPASRAPFFTPDRGIGWSFEWDDDDDDWSNTAYWECPAGCSVTFWDESVDPAAGG
jgi:hypothetical protein